jgi:hypothetical protein
MALERLTEARVDQAMATLAETDAEAAEWKVSVLRTEQKVKRVKALVYAALEGSIEDRKQGLELDPRVEQAWEEHFASVKGHELCKNRREREVLVIELWRSVNASRRMGTMT